MRAFRIFWSQNPNGPFVYLRGTRHTAQGHILSDDMKFADTYWQVRCEYYNEFGQSIGLSDPSQTVTLVPASPGRQILTRVAARGTIQEYYLRLPPNWSNFPNESWNTYPVLLFLHGAGEIGGDPAKVKVHGPPKLIDSGTIPPHLNEFIVISPHMASGGVEQWFDSSRSDVLFEILNHIDTTYRGDVSRTAITGLSRGGRGAIGLYSRFPHYFSACLETCGFKDGIPDPAGYEALSDKPLWIHHGMADATVPFSESEFIVSRLASLNASFTSVVFNASHIDIPPPQTFFIYPGFGHDVWTTAYADNTSYRWLLQQERTLQPPSNVLITGGGAFDPDQPFSISVTADGIDPRYQWYKDDVLIPEATSATYSVDAARGIHRGSYKCRVSNRDGATDSSAVQVWVSWLQQSVGQTNGTALFPYGTALAPEVLDITFSPELPGSFELSPVENTRLFVGFQFVNVTFTPDDSTYLPVFYQASVDVTPLPVTVHTGDLTIFFGDDETPLLTTFTGFLPEHAAPLPEFWYQYNQTAYAVGVYDGTVNIFNQHQFPYNQYQYTIEPFTLTILPAPMTLTVENKSRAFGADNPAFTATYQGDNNEALDFLYGQTTFSTTAVKNSPPGTYPITAVADLPNYTITYVAGTLTVTNTAPQIISLNAMPNVLGLTGKPSEFTAVASDMDGHPLTITWDFGDGSTASGFSASHTFSAPGAYTVTFTVSDGFGPPVTQTLTYTVIAGATTFPSGRFFFTPGVSEYPGYMQDNGDIYSSQKGYGWEAFNQHPLNGFETWMAPASPDLRYNLFLPTQTDSAPNEQWHVGVPNGNYAVTVVAGSPSAINSYYEIEAEGQVILSGKPTGTQRWVVARAIVSVTDEKLTLSNGPNAINNRICFVDIDPADAVIAALPAAPQLEPLAIKAFSATVNFDRLGHDSIRLQVELPTLPANFKPNGQTLDLDIMGVISQYKFRNGKFSINNIFYESEGLLKYSKSKKAWILTLSMKDADFNTTWTVNGLRAPDGNVEFTFAARLNGQVFGGSKSVKRSSKNGKKATLK